MFKCNSCGRKFDVPITWVEPHGERMSGCPFCHGYSIEDYEEPNPKINKVDVAEVALPIIGRLQKAMSGVPLDRLHDLLSSANDDLYDLILGMVPDDDENKVLYEKMVNITEQDEAREAVRLFSEVFA